MASKCPDCKNTLTRKEGPCASCGWTKQTGSVGICRATLELMPNCNEPKMPTSSYCRKHAYIDSQTINPHQPTSIFQHVPPIEDPAPENFFVAVALMRWRKGDGTMKALLLEEFQNAFTLGITTESDKEVLAQMIRAERRRDLDVRQFIVCSCNLRHRTPSCWHPPAFPCPRTPWHWMTQEERHRQLVRDRERLIAQGSYMEWYPEEPPAVASKTIQPAEEVIVEADDTKGENHGMSPIQNPEQ